MEIEICHLKKCYGKQTVLDIESLKIHSGVITAIVGPNGAGKSTLLNIIAGLIDDYEGEILYNHSSLIPYPKMTLAFQEPYLIHTTVKENIAYPLKIRKQSSQTINQRINELSQDLHLEALLNKKSDQLSLGEVQKVALARALSFQPELLLLDEPSANIDPHTTYDIENMLMKMKDNQNTTIVLITHNLAQAKRLADHIVFIKDGQVIESCSQKQFFEQPTQPMSQKFIEGELLI